MTNLNGSRERTSFVATFTSNSAPSTATTFAIILATPNASASRFSAYISSASSTANTWWLPICIYSSMK